MDGCQCVKIYGKKLLIQSLYHQDGSPFDVTGAIWIFFFNRLNIYILNIYKVKV